ncbi:MAG: hypothetical protein ABJY83_11315 [Roseibium sp.]
MATPLKSGFICAFALSAFVVGTPAQAQSTDCVNYATEYANSYVGNGDPIGDAVSGGMAGAVVGGAVGWPVGPRRGAKAGAALGVLDNMGSVPGGWDAMYDMAYQMCLQQTSGVNAPPLELAPNLMAPSPNCRSSVTVNKGLQRTPEGGITVGSGGNGCN